MKPYSRTLTAVCVVLLADVGANDLISVSSRKDDNLKRPMPLKVVEDGGSYRLYAGRKYVTLTLQ